VPVQLLFDERGDVDAVDGDVVELAGDLDVRQFGPEPPHAVSRVPRTSEPLRSTARIRASLRSTREKLALRRLCRSKRAPLRSCSTNSVIPPR
jgi:hypothetical protein